MQHRSVASLKSCSINHSAGVKFLATSQIVQFSLSSLPSALPHFYVLLTSLCDNVCGLVYPSWVASMGIIVNNCHKAVSSPTHSHITSVLFVIYSMKGLLVHETTVPPMDRADICTLFTQVQVIKHCYIIAIFQHLYTWTHDRCDMQGLVFMQSY